MNWSISAIKRIALPLGGVLLATTAVGQTPSGAVNRATLQAQIVSMFPTNGTGQITAAILRSFLTTFTNSTVLWLGDLLPLTPGATPLDCSGSALGGFAYGSFEQKLQCSGAIITPTLTIGSDSAAAANATAINSAIQEVGALGGGTVQLACGSISIGATIDNDVGRVTVAGCGRDDFHDNGLAQGTTLKATFAGVLAKHRSPTKSQVSPAYRLTGGGFVNLTLNANSLATRLLEVTSRAYCTEHVTTLHATGTEAVLITALDTTTDYDDVGDTQHCDINVSAAQYSGGTDCLRLDGTAISNTSLNHIAVLCEFTDGNAITVADADNNFIEVRGARSGGGIGYGVLCKGSIYPNPFPGGCNNNNFVTVSTGGPIYASGTGDAGITHGVSNYIGFLDKGNGTATPTQGTGSSWTYFSNLYNVASFLAQNTTGIADSITDADACRARMTVESLRICNGSSAGLIMDDDSATNVWAQRINGADLELLALAGGGSFNITSPIKANGVATLSATVSVRKGDNSGACNIVVSAGLITSTTC